MGLKNASQQFQQMMDDILSDFSDFVTPYIDDILVGTRLEEGEEFISCARRHELHLRRLLDKMACLRLVCDRKKCELFVKNVAFCGHILGGGERRPAPGRLCAIEKWERPQTITALRAFLGFTNYYSAYVKDYAFVAARLQEN